MKRIPDKVRAAVLTRADGQCERCGHSVANIPASIHHRRTAGAGGNKHSHYIENLALLCGTGTTGCHGWVTENPAAAGETGWYVHQWEDPETVSMEDTEGCKFIFDGDQVIYL